MNQATQEQGRLNSLIQKILGSWTQRHEPIPHVLYHYTSSEGLIGILNSKSIWMTDLRYMNDMSELQYSRDLVRDRLWARGNVEGLIDIQQEFIKIVSSTFDPFSFADSVFSVSFCEQGNLLSQWRAYRGRGGGYAIGFDFFHLVPLLNRYCVLRKVEYDEQEQVRLTDSIIDEFLNFLRTESKENNFLANLSQTFRSIMGELFVSFKHSGFREEKEWRLVHIARGNPTINRDTEIPKFRSYEGHVIPYYPVDFENAVKLSCDDTYGHAFPIVDLMIGPTMNADLMQESVKLLLLSLNPDIVPNISRSEIPLRWL